MSVVNQDPEKPPAESKRNPDGTWKEGCSGNIAGRPRGIMSGREYSEMLDEMLDKYTIGDLRDFAAHPEKMDDFSVKKGQIIRAMVDSITKGGGIERERILVRLLGPPPQKMVHEGGDPDKPVKLGFTINFHSPSESTAPTDATGIPPAPSIPEAN